MSVRVTAKDIRNEGLVLITPSEDIFASLLASSGESLSAVETVSPYSVILRNTGKHAAVSFMVKWDLVRTDGIVLSRQYEYLTAWALEGQGINQQGGHILRPGSDWFLVPGFIMELKKLKTPTSTQAQSVILTKIAADMAEFSSINVSLDGVFFDDGSFVGPHKSGFFEKVVAFHKARRDLLEELSMKSKRDDNQGDILSSVESLAKQPKVKLGRKSTVDDYYNKFKADFADELVRMKRVSGTQKTLEHHLKFLETEWAKLEKRD